MSGTDHVIVSGLKNKPNLEEMAFKSYGNAEGGLAWIAKMTISSLEKSTAPAMSDVVFVSFHIKSLFPFNANNNNLLY